MCRGAQKRHGFVLDSVQFSVLYVADVPVYAVLRFSFFPPICSAPKPERL